MENDKFTGDGSEIIVNKTADPKWLIIDREENKAFRVKAKDENEAVRKWYRNDPNFADEKGCLIDDAYRSGNLEINVIKESTILDI